jgi:hypothetical protein
LGLTFASDGNWTNHIDSIVNAAFKKVNVLRKLKYVDNYTSIEDILYYAFCKMLSVSIKYIFYLHNMLARYGMGVLNEK